MVTLKENKIGKVILSVNNEVNQQKETEKELLLEFVSNFNNQNFTYLVEKYMLTTKEKQNKIEEIKLKKSIRTNKEVKTNLYDSLCETFEENLAFVKNIVMYIENDNVSVDFN